MRQASTAERPLRANRVQFGAWVPAEMKVPTTVVTATATVIEATGPAANSPDQPPTSSRDRCTTHTASSRINGVETSETQRSEEHTSELQSRENLVCRLLLEKKK